MNICWYYGFIHTSSHIQTSNHFRELLERWKLEVMGVTGEVFLMSGRGIRILNFLTKSDLKNDFELRKYAYRPKTFSAVDLNWRKGGHVAIYISRRITIFSRFSSALPTRSVRQQYKTYVKRNVKYTNAMYKNELNFVCEQKSKRNLFNGKTTKMRNFQKVTVLDNSLKFCI